MMTMTGVVVVVVVVVEAMVVKMMSRVIDVLKHSSMGMHTLNMCFYGSFFKYHA